MDGEVAGRASIGGGEVIGRASIGGGEVAGRASIGGGEVAGRASMGGGEGSGGGTTGTVCVRSEVSAGGGDGTVRGRPGSTVWALGGPVRGRAGPVPAGGTAVARSSSISSRTAWRNGPLAGRRGVAALWPPANGRSPTTAPDAASPSAPGMRG
jgi:hypothetical protein